MAGRQQGSEYYDELYLTGDRTYDQPLTSPYYPLFRKVDERVRQESLGTILEVGCGSGVLAEMLIAGGVRYEGFDISPVAVEKARARNPAGRFFVGDAVDAAAYDRSYDGIVCCEVLEHIDADLSVIECWKAGSVAVCSVPNFDYESHVRFFRSEKDILDRYGALLDIRWIARVAKSASANLSGAEYFRRIRWARNQPRRLLGIFGINAFAWHGGWFLFAGRRR